MSEFFDILKKQKKTQKKIINKILEGKKVIRRIIFQVCSDCQNNCQFCNSKHLIDIYKNYHLTIQELNKFIYYTKKSNYYYNKILLYGPGEPTLWDNLNEGIKILYNSGITDNICMYSNGVSIDNIKEETWSYLNNIRFSIYPSTKNKKYLREIQKKYGKNKISEVHIHSFYSYLTKKQKGNIPCKCLCPGPTFIKDKIFFFCHCPSLFTAAKIMGVNIFDYENIYSKLKENYLVEIEDEIEQTRDFEFCKYCVANSNVVSSLRHKYKHKMLD